MPKRPHFRHLAFGTSPALPFASKFNDLREKPMNKLLSLSVLAITAITFAAPAFAEPKKARDNDLVDSYELLDNSKLVRRIGNLSCDVTSGVTSFKVSQHPNDAAMIYFMKDGDLHYLKNPAGAVRKKGECPKAEKALLLANVKDYTVVPTQKTEIVNMALTHEGRLVAWPNTGRPLVDVNGIKELKMNPCNDQAGFSFKKYVAFAESRDGRILKIEGDKPSDSAFTPESFDSIGDFKEKQNVCVQQNKKSNNNGGGHSLD